MSDWIEATSALEAGGKPYVLITILGARGSTPRDNGTKMLVSEQRSYCTIGGGQLEYQAIAIAREMLLSGGAEQRIEAFPLDARVGQCCGGSTSILFESFPGSSLNIMLFGAGHVGTALVGILQQLPCSLRWVDTRAQQFPAQVAANITLRPSDEPAAEVASMPAGSYYIVMTHNHPMDFAITEAIIKRGDARYAGLIGSNTKWQRFQMRLQRQHYSAADIAQIRCPIGLAAVPGKLPIEVAISVAGEIITEYHRDLPARETRRGIDWQQLKALASDAPQDSDQANNTVMEKQ